MVGTRERCSMKDNNERFLCLQAAGTHVTYTHTLHFFFCFVFSILTDRLVCTEEVNWLFDVPTACYLKTEEQEVDGVDNPVIPGVILSTRRVTIIWCRTLLTRTRSSLCAKGHASVLLQ